MLLLVLLPALLAGAGAADGGSERAGGGAGELSRDGQVGPCPPTCLARWTWDRVHLLVAPQAFHAALGDLLATSGTLPQAAEALPYSSLLPSLAPSLATLHTLLTDPAMDADTALFMAKTHLHDHEWRLLRLTEVLPGPRRRGW